MENTITRKHLAVAILLLESYIDIKKDLKKKMTHFMLDDDFQRRMIVFMNLVKYPQSEWNVEKESLILSNLITYIFCMLVQMKPDLENCFAELEKCMKREKEQRIMTNTEYLYYRRTNFELRRVIERLIENNNYNVTIYNESKIRIIYQHIEI